MKNRKTKIISLILSLAIMMTSVIIMPISVSAASVAEQDVKTLSLWADPQGRVNPNAVTVSTDDGKSTVSALGLVQAHTISSSYSASSTDNNYFMFLPSTADTERLVLYFDNGSQTSTVIKKPNGTSVTVTNGIQTDIFNGYGTDYTAAGTWVITLNGADYNFHVAKSAQVGTVYLNTSSGSMDYINSADKTAKTSDTGSIQVYQANGTQDYSGGLAKISGHGNGSWDDFKTKLSYNIKLESSTSLCGMAKAKKWILLSGATDGGASGGTSSSAETSDTQIKNRLTYDYADYIGVKYQPGVQPVDLYCNGHYTGSYELVEKPEIKSNRININDAYENLEIANGSVDETTGQIIPADFDTLSGIATRAINKSDTTVSNYSSSTSSFNYSIGSRLYTAYKSGSSISPSYSNINDPDDLTGGYIFGLEVGERWVQENTGFCAYARQGWTIRSCDYISRHMIDYCYGLIYAMGSAVYQSNGNVPSGSTTTGGGGGILYNSTYKTTNPAPEQQYQGMHWSDILDANSAVTYYWTQEFFKNMDASTTSTYFYKDSDSVDSKIYAGPVWDSDNTMCGSGERFGVDYGTNKGWYVTDQRIYKYYANTNNTENSGMYNATPYSFYAALSKQSDFNAMKEYMWYQKVSPAVDILLGKAPDSGRLHSIQWYTDELKDSAAMNNIRFGGTTATYEQDSVINYLTTWISGRQTWINENINTLSIANASIASIPEQSFTGSPILPAITVTYQDSVLGEQTLTEGTDYTVEFADNINVGTASVIITGIGRFAGTTKKAVFNITANDITDGTLNIYDAAYIGDTVEPILLDKNGMQITSGVTYNWYINGSEVGTGSTYTVSQSDAGKTLTAAAFGDNKSVTGSLKSADCPIAATTRPSGSVKNIASFNWKYGDDGTSLQGGKTKGYAATSGIQKDTAKIHASVDGVNNASLSWSGSDTFTRTDSTSGQQPVMEPSGTTVWNEYPYFNIEFSTSDFSQISFSADIGATSKGAKYYALMYSVNGGNFKYLYNENPVDEYDYIYYEFSSLDKKVMKTAFDVTLPEECSYKDSVTVRIIVEDDTTLDGAATMFTTTNANGKIAINNVTIDGTKTNDVTGLDAPVIETASGALFTDDTVTITETNAGADIKYTLTDELGNVSGEYKYNGAFALFRQINANAVTLTVWCEADIYKSDTVTAVYTNSGDALAQFSYKNYSDEIINGKLPANSGTLGKSTLMYTVADDTSQYVPMYNAEKKAFVLAPDDTAKWSSDSGFYFELSTAGYKDVKISCDAYTTASGPKSTSLQYSLDGKTWITAQGAKDLPANNALESYLSDTELPASCNNKANIYIRIVTDENQTNTKTELWNNASKGNLYINNIIISAASDGTLKMPYTNKSTDYFGATGTLKYYSPDNEAMQYTVTNKNNEVVLSGAYPQAGIQPTLAKGFNAYVSEPYKVSVWAGDDDDKSIVNTRTYYYKGDVITEFDMSTSRFAANISPDACAVGATTGTGSLSMYPNSVNAAQLSYTDTYGVKVAWSSANPFISSKTHDKADSNGFWLIETSSTGYTDLTMSLSQLASNKGVRDWGVAYSIDGVNYTYVNGSNSRAISNDASSKPVQTYSNLALPAECDNREKLFIKVFINGGESVDGTELELVTKGNIGINDIAISGIGKPKEYTATVTASVLENPTDAAGKYPLPNIDVYVDDVLAGTTDSNGNVTFTVLSGTTYTVRFDNGKFSRTIKLVGGDGAAANVPLVSLDINGDGYINIKDYNQIYRMQDAERKALYEKIYMDFVFINYQNFNY